MKSRKARLIRAGILAARDPERTRYIHLAHPVVREAARRETVRIEDRALLARLKAMRHEWMLAAINSDNPEQIRTFNA